jgi:tRNA threonylcarbamoyladenosine biosynthesis protein TsaB
VRLLALETATAAGAVALEVDGVLFDELVTTRNRQHTETLLAGALSLLDAAEMTISEIDAVVVDVGPGLFTGLRVGVSTARSLAMASGIGVIGLSSLEILAADEAVSGAEAVLGVVDARRGEVFAQLFTSAEAGFEPRSAPVVLAPEGLVNLVERFAPVGASVAVIGDGALRYEDAVRSIQGALLVESVSLPSPAVACRLARRRGVAARLPVEVVPIYLRDPDAIANFSVAPTRPER